MKKTFSYQGKLIPYELKFNKNQQNIVLNVSAGNIRVSSPLHANDWEIEQLIYKNINKILQAIANFQNHQKLLLAAMDGQVVLDQQIYRLVLTDENVHTKIIGDSIIMKRCESVDQTSKKLYNFLKGHFAFRFETLFKKWEEVMNIQCKNLSVKIMTRKWGVCYPKEGKINLNIKLIHFPDWIIEYVIVHELSHFVHHNHSKDFWHLVERYFPKYREAMDVLKRPGI